MENRSSSTWSDWFRHAFAIKHGATEVSEHEERLIQAICREVSRRRLTPAAIAFLEMARPLNYLGAQTMHFFAPIASALFDDRTYQDFARFLERRDAIDILCNRLEASDTGPQTCENEEPTAESPGSRSEPPLTGEPPA